MLILGAMLVQNEGSRLFDELYLVEGMLLGYMVLHLGGENAKEKCVLTFAVGMLGGFREEIVTVAYVAVLVLIIKGN